LPCCSNFAKVVRHIMVNSATVHSAVPRTHSIQLEAFLLCSLPCTMLCTGLTAQQCGRCHAQSLVALVILIVIVIVIVISRLASAAGAPASSIRRRHAPVLITTCMMTTLIAVAQRSKHIHRRVANALVEVAVALVARRRAVHSCSFWLISTLLGHASAEQRAFT